MARRLDRLAGMIKKHMGRRDFIQKVAAATAFGTAAPLAGAKVVASPAAGGRQRARNVILMVADGMGTGTLSLAHRWSLMERGRMLNWMELYERPGFFSGLQDTASASSPVTDSAAGGSAWGCGQRVPNRRINTTAEGEALRPIALHGREMGKRVGMVTTARVTHATPASFAANVAHRNEEGKIAAQYLSRGVDLLLGGGASRFEGEGGQMDRKMDMLLGLGSSRVEGGEAPVDRVSTFREAGYRICRNRAEMESLAESKRGQPLLGLFSEGYLPYAVDRSRDRALGRQVPGLPAMTKVALQELGTSSNGFLLQVEGGRVDHAGHANDPAAILHEQLEFDEAIAVVLEFQKEHPDTLLIVTTDHGTGGCQLNGVGPGNADTAAALGRLKDYKMSIEVLTARLQAGEGIEELLTVATSAKPSPAVVERTRRIFLEAKTEKKEDVWRTQKALTDMLYEGTGIGWSGGMHTGECVECLAGGPGAEALPRFFENHQLFSIMANAMV